MSRRHFSSVAADTTLSGGITNVATSFAVASLAGWPSVPFTAALDPDDGTLRELILVTAVSGGSITNCTRGYDSTANQGHASGATLRHAVAGIDYDEANDHVNSSANVHGIGGGSSVVGTATTQTLTNKTLTAPTIVGGSWGEVSALTLGAGYGGPATGTYSPQYRRWGSGGKVELRGGIELPPTMTTAGANLFTLPAGYRPAADVMFTVVAVTNTNSRVTMHIAISSGGAVNVYNGIAYAMVHLDGIYFETS